MNATTTTEIPLSDQADGWRPASVWRAIALSLLLFLVMVAVQFVFEIGPDRVSETFGFVISQVAAWLVALYVAVRWSRTTWRDLFPLHPFSTRLVLPLVVLCGGLYILLGQATALIPEPGFLSRMREDDPETAWYLYTIVAMLIAPLEEMLFRGWLLKGLRARYSTRKAIIVSAIVYAVFSMNPWGILVAFAIGVLFAWLVVRTGSLWPAIIGHVATGAMVGVLALLLGGEGYYEGAIEHMTVLPPALLIAGGVFVVGGWFWLTREMRGKPVPSAQRAASQR